MAVNDPIGDMIARIRNAQMRAKSKVSMPGSKQRERVCEVLKTEGYIRGYASVAHADGRSELEIELKYFDGGRQGARDRAEILRRRAGDPRDFACLQARPARLRLGQGIAAHQ